MYGCARCTVASGWYLCCTADHDVLRFTTPRARSDNGEAHGVVQLLAIRSRYEPCFPALPSRLVNAPLYKGLADAFATMPLVDDDGVEI